MFPTGGSSFAGMRRIQMIIRKQKKYAFLRHVDEHAIEGGNIHIDVHGQENIPKENGFMFFPNHQGLFDVLAIIKACPVPFSVVAKKEVGDIPFLKQVFACMKAFIIDRERPEAVHAGHCQCNTGSEGWS